MILTEAQGNSDDSFVVIAAAWRNRSIKSGAHTDKQPLHSTTPMLIPFLKLLALLSLLLLLLLLPVIPGCESVAVLNASTSAEQAPDLAPKVMRVGSSAGLTL